MIKITSTSEYRKHGKAMFQVSFTYGGKAYTKHVDVTTLNKMKLGVYKLPK